jgi:hypothetical protein
MYFCIDPGADKSMKAKRNKEIKPFTCYVEIKPFNLLCHLMPELRPMFACGEKYREERVTEQDTRRHAIFKW